jgi:hypothetical protein
MKQFSLIRHSYLRSLFLVGFYALFFSVELFHNFDSDKKSETSIASVATVAQSQSFSAASKCKKHNPLPKTNFRLNKRFQPSFIPSEFVFAPEVFVEHVERNYPTTYSNGSLSNIFLLTKSLRAPPIV